MERNRCVPNFACFAWLAAVAALVVTLGALGFARAAAAQPLPPSGATLLAGSADFEEDDEGEDEGEEGDRCEFDDEAAEEACEEAEEEGEAEEAEAEECRLESAEATVAAVPGRNQLRLRVRYKTFEPSAVAIELGLRGGRGALDLGTEIAHFGRSGTLHKTHALTDLQMARALAAKEFTVAVHALNTPGFCDDAFERHLTARRGAGSGLQWSDPGATRRAKAARASRAAG